MPLLKVNQLKVYYTTMRGYVRAVDSVNFEVEKGGSMGIAGESGCGKTTVALSLLRILPSNGRIVDGSIFFKGEDIAKLDEDDMREKIRWKEISMIFQGSMNALNPVHRISDQIVEAIQLHEPETSKREAKERAAKLLELVGIDPSRMDNYPHEYSGGMRQRTVIAMALACNPSLVIADEPTTALDVIVAAQVLKLLRELKNKLNLGMILISHDLSVIAEICNTVGIMYAGKMVEYGDIVGVFKEPLHPYTKGLMESFPSVDAKEKMKMISIPGSPPNLLAPPPGCRFHPRCPFAKKICKEKEPQFLEYSDKRFVACHMVQALHEGKKW